MFSELLWEETVFFFDIGDVQFEGNKLFTIFQAESVYCWHCVNLHDELLLTVDLLLRAFNNFS